MRDRVPLRCVSCGHKWEAEVRPDQVLAEFIGCPSCMRLWCVVADTVKKNPGESEMSAADQLRCRVCGHQWRPKKPLSTSTPKKCPSCGSHRGK